LIWVIQEVVLKVGKFLLLGVYLYRQDFPKFSFSYPELITLSNGTYIAAI